MSAYLQQCHIFAFWMENKLCTTKAHIYYIALPCNV